MDVGLLASARRIALAGTLALGSLVFAQAASPGARPAAADLRVRLVVLPTETRPGGSVTYSATVANHGTRAAKNVALRVAGDATVDSVSAGRLACSVDLHVRVDCSLGVLRPRASASVEVAGLAGGLGTLRVEASATSSTTEAVPRDNTARAAIAVRPPDSVEVRASRFFTGTQPEQQLAIDAISAPHGQDPAGTFSLAGLGEEVNGRVTCLHVSGNRAIVGVAIDHTDMPPGPGVTPTDWLVFALVDNGSPGAGRDTFTYGGGTGPAGAACLLPLGGVAGFPVAGGEITIVDTP
jgi:Domain of unknown function DUF11